MILYCLCFIVAVGFLAFLVERTTAGEKIVEKIIDIMMEE